LSDRSQTGTPQGRTADRACIEIVALNQEVRKPRGPAEPADLIPEPTSLEAEMQVGDSLPLDQNAGSKIVVPDGKSSVGDLDTSLPKRLRNTAPILVGIGDDPAH